MSTAVPPPRELDFPKARRWGARILVAVVVLALLYYAFSAFVNVSTNVMWFGSVHEHGVYTTILGAQIWLFLIFAVLTALVLGGSLFLLRRRRPRFHPDPEKQKWRFRWQQHDRLVGRYLLPLVVLFFAVRTGSAAAGRWSLWLAWRHSAPWHQTDPQFHRDISYFVDVYPFHRAVLSLLTGIVVMTIVVSLVVAFMDGALQLRGEHRGTTPALRGHLSLLLGIYLVLKAGSLWLDRFAVSFTGGGPVTGPSYTDVHALLPGKILLIVVTLICAVLLFVNFFVRRWTLAITAVATLAVALFVVGIAWPGLVHKLREQPSEFSLDQPLIQRNVAGTLSAFGLHDRVTTDVYDRTPLTGSALTSQAGRNAQIRILDPNRLSPTFNVRQQLQAYYGFKSTLDIDHYPIDGQQQDVALAVRELNMAKIPHSTWTNNHLVYTHGWGVVAAPTDQMNPKTGIPEFVNGGLPPQNAIPVTRPQVYFGQSSPSYSIVGQPEGSSRQVEFDHPSSTGSDAPVHTTYQGDGGIPIGSTFRRFLYAVKLHDPNILFSGEINDASQLLTVRDPRKRVAAVAPWLTLDGTTYPVVVDGTVQWVVDGYTTSNTYPESQQVNLRSATSNTFTRGSSTTTQPNTNVNYMRNSVKAVVDAYTGKVTLYEWDQQQQPDYLLKTWENAFPGLVKPESEIPAGIMDHLRYPMDLFGVQRTLLTKYHITKPGDFYSGSGFWKVPADPTVSASNVLNTTSTGKAGGGGPSPAIPPTYMTMSTDGFGEPGYVLSTPMATLNGRDLAALVTVNAVPGPDYGKFTVLAMPPGASVEAPSQVQNDIESSTQISEALTLQRGGNSKVLLGNLLAMPLGGQVLYVEPVYTQAAGGNSFPVLRHVIAVYGNGAPTFEPTLEAAVRKAVRLGDPASQ